MPDYTPMQLRHARALERTGRAVKVLADGAALGVERRLAGNEAGIKTVKGRFKDKAYQLAAPQGDTEQLRGEADEARAVHREKQLTLAAASLGFVPTERTRVLDGSTTYAVRHVDRKLYGDDPVEYTLILRVV